MNIHEVRQELRRKNINDIPLRVTFYARVSTEKEEQESSLKHQKQYYKELIQKNPAWEYVDGYVDEGLSGLSTKKREQFNQMISDAHEGKFDYIITKEITRFARNTLDSIMFTRELLRCGVAVLFQSDGINTIEEDSELRLTIMGGIAQDDSRRTSARVKFGHKQAIKNGVVIGNSKIFGYKKDRGKLVIDEEQKNMVCELFELYGTGRYSMKQIEDIFWEKGYRNTKGNRISHTTMSNMIRNPKYKGYYCGGKVQIIDMFTKQQKFLPEKEWTMWKDETGERVPAIVSEEVWDKANAVLRERSNIVKSRSNSLKRDNIYTGKIICEKDKVPYYLQGNVLKNGEKRYYWVCSHKAKHGKDACRSIPLYEDDLNKIFIDIINELKRDPDTITRQYLELFMSSQDKGNSLKEAEALQRELELIEKKKDKILEFNLEGHISDDEFLKRNANFNKQIEQVNAKLEALDKKKLLYIEVEKQMRDMNKTIKELAANLEKQKEFKLTKYDVDAIVDKIYVSQVDDGNVSLMIRLKTTDIHQRIISRSGHTIKKMIESYEQGLK